MIKFVLVMQMCFTLSQTCVQPIRYTDLFDTHKECSLLGYKNAYAIIENRPDYEVNEQKAMITFWCLEEKVENT
jgi:hypothetical protein